MKKEKKVVLSLSIPGTEIKLKLDKVVASVIKFACLSIIIFGLLKLGVKLKKPTQWVSVRNFKEMKKFFQNKFNGKINNITIK